ncbi:DUF4381 domain-containing protein [Vibrio ezurae]|uniref:DUF4381 domain-containing protein n=1 Tax=Vibrio ezurae NBRC 102218 TaxID=1219080 RepID=U3CP26_9VIBR|nr:DUF4381 domain-containing protein [Vibrio ezurae]GAD79893.1 hypothetical protein VEZ01S_21_00160 [Vibrio ezurae NBRC 102218]
MNGTTETLKPASMNAMLSGLGEPSLPAPISWIPNAPGWYLVLLIIAIWLIYRGFKAYRQYQANAYRRMALLELQSLDKDGLRLIPQLLRRTALNAYPRHQVSPLLGSEWEKWLDEQCKNSQFSSQLSGLLATLSYAPNASINESAAHNLIAQTAHWIKHHEVNHD